MKCSEMILLPGVKNPPDTTDIGDFHLHPSEEEKQHQRSLSQQLNCQFAAQSSAQSQSWRCYENCSLSECLWGFS